MSMLDSFFNKGFRGSKCKTLLKLTIPRIKLLRNRRELQIKQMRKEIAKLLQTGQEATARIRVEHIVREENMMAAQEIIELFSELISVRLPIIETQRECPLDLKEAISSLCFAAPRCADLPELIQVQLAFASKYGKEFVAAATELMPDCGVNRQLIELLSVRAPPAEKKLNLLKEIAEEHGVDWDPAASETELFKSHEDLLDGSTQYVSGTKVPLPKERHEEVLQSASSKVTDEQYDSDPGLDFPDVPTTITRPNAAKDAPPLPSAPHPELNQRPATGYENLGRQTSNGPDDDDEYPANDHETPRPPEARQFVPFILPPFSSQSPSVEETAPMVRTETSDPSPQSLPKVKPETEFDLQDVLLAAQAAAESAACAAAAARSAASLAQLRISELSSKRSGPSLDVLPDNPFGMENSILSPTEERQQFDPQISSADSDNGAKAAPPHSKFERQEGEQFTNESSGFPTFGYDHNASLFKSSSFDEQVNPPPQQQPHRMTSEDDLLSSYPNLFGSGGHSFTENSRSNT